MTMPRSTSNGSFARLFADYGMLLVLLVLGAFFPSRADSVGLKLFSSGGPASVPALDAWEMMPSNP